ncbi:DUF2183 domain-containing protein [Gangjinia marincola]|uniref:DUF2183 domain-containing protein n=1 Tax=Gangjinia marincola TaxID=578463 RepID=A0ABN1MIT8_9FLAO
MAPFTFISNIIDDPDPVIVYPFDGYANKSHIYAQARVLEDEGIQHHEEDSVLKNIYNTYKRFATDEIHNAKVRVRCDEETFITYSDKEGYIYIDHEHNFTLKHQQNLWLPLTYELLVDDTVIHTVTASILKPHPKVNFAVISDIDDTLLETGVTSFFKWRLLVNSVAKHSDKRKAFKNAAKLYQQLKKGPSGYGDNPMFYLSNSPWNLHEYIHSFLNRNDFPKGPLLMRDFGLENKKKDHFTEENKYLKSKHLLTIYPETNFILVGDAGELDTDIYLELAKEFPGRILAIYIRKVKKKKNNARVEAILTAQTDIEVLLFKETKEALAHARERGFIEPL